MKKWPGLKVEGIYDDATQIYNYHPQLQLEESYHHFRRVNDAFTMLTVRELQGNIGRRISLEAAALV